MSDHTDHTDHTDKAGYLARLWKNDSTRKGIAAMAAGLVIGAVSELIWPSSD